MQKIFNGEIYGAILLGIIFWTSCQSPYHAPINQSQNEDSILYSEPILPFTDSITEFPKNPNLYFERSDALFSLRNYSLASRDLKRAISLNPSQPIYPFALGEVEIAMDSFRQAINNFILSIHINPGIPRVRLELANAYYHLGNYQPALRELDTLLRANPKLQDGYGLRSKVYQDIKDTLQAKKALEEAISINPNNYDPLMALGDLESSQGNGNAIIWYKKAWNLDTTQAEPWFSIGAYHLKIKETQQAIMDFSRCIKIDPNYSAAYLSLGKIFLQQNQMKKAFNIYSLATKIAPTNAKAYYGLGLSSLNLGDKKGALIEFRQAYALDNHFLKAKAEIDKLK